MSAKLRIVFIVPDCGEGGLFQFYNQLVPELGKSAEVHVIFCSQFHVSVVPSIPGATCHFLPAEAVLGASKKNIAAGPLGLAPSIASALAVANQAWEVALSLEPDCVEVCDWPLSFAPAVLCQSVPYVVQCHGSFAQIGERDPQPGQAAASLLAQLIEPQLASAAYRLQTYSSGNASFWENIAGRSVEMIRPAFALPAPPKDRQIVSGNSAVFGRLQCWKGPHILCEALRLLGSRAPEVDWYGGVKRWGTDGRGADEFLQQSFPEIWGTKLHHYHAVQRALVENIQAGALFNIVPSAWDVFNFTAVEAMAAGRPTIVSTGAGASELIVHGENGFTFRSEEPESLAGVIDNLLVMPEGRRREIGMAGRETVGSELNPKRIAEQRLAAYEDAIRTFADHSPKPPNTWLADLLAWPPIDDFDLGSVLEAFPIRKIGRHACDRILRRLTQ